MKRRTLIVTAFLLIAGAVAGAALTATTCRAATAKVTGLSRPSAKVGATLTIKGKYFGASQGSSTVTFGERRNVLGFAPCAKKAKVVSWSRSSVRVRVPEMAPGSHKLYVTVGGRASKSHPFSITPIKTISNRSFTTSSADGNEIPASHDVLYDGCTFTATSRNMPGTSSGVMLINGWGGDHYDITFRNCTFKSNLGAGGGGDYGVNGVKMVDGGGTVHDITFRDCRFEAFSRMGIELVGTDGAGPTFSNIALLGCSFEPCGGEPISFSTWYGNNPTRGRSVNSLVDGCTIKGYGNMANVQYGGAIESNGSQDIEVRNTEIWSGTAPAFNLNLRASSRAFLAKNVTVDFSHTNQAYGAGASSQIVTSDGMSYSRWQACTFNTGTAGNHCGYGIDIGDHCSYNDFSGSTITGAVAKSYFVYGSGATGNTMPRVK